MGTRADFYLGRGENAAWIGSIAWDGYPDGFKDTGIMEADTETRFVDAVKAISKTRDDWTSPDQGWPWPWKDSQTTDYAYAFDDGKVWCSHYGHEWFDPLKPEPDLEAEDCKVAVFPDMTSRKNVTLGERSGLITLAPPSALREEEKRFKKGG